MSVASAPDSPTSDASRAPARPWTHTAAAAAASGARPRATNAATAPPSASPDPPTPSVGFDHVDVEAATARGVWVCNVPDYCVEEMADSSLALLLALMRGVVALDRSVREGEWDHAVAGPLRVNRGTRLGVIGFGRIGRALATRALALGFEPDHKLLFTYSLLARALIDRPEILLYDEPTTGLDPVATKNVDEMIRQTADDFGVTSVVISHDMASTFRIGDRISMLHGGKIVVSGTPQEVLVSRHPALREFVETSGLVAPEEGGQA